MVWGDTADIYINRIISAVYLGWHLWVVFGQKNNQGNGTDILEHVLGYASVKSALVGLLFVLYIVVSFYFSASAGGNARYDKNQDKYFAIRGAQKEQYEISQEEYQRMIPHSIRAITSFPLIIGCVGYLFIVGSRRKD